MKKILLVTSTFSEQDSVAAIVKNIIQSFKSIPHLSVKVVAIEHIADGFSLSKYDSISIIHPMVILSARAERFWRDATAKNLKIIYFVFGDFIRKAAYLIKLNHLMLNQNIHFVAASSAYQKLVQKCVANKNDVSLCPFPLNPLDFKFDSKARERFRKKYQLGENDRALLYTGRISIQKNIEQLLESFIELKQKYKAGKLKLFVLGNVDDFESPTFYQKKLNPGAYFQKLKKISSICLPDELYFIAHSEQNFLREAYNGCDLFVSLSLYHDEDFGYSPLEALACGTPVVCTKWGGFRDFKRSQDKHASVELINVAFEDGALLVDNGEIEKKILKSLKKSYHSKSRSEFFRKVYSPQTLSVQYKKLLNSRRSAFGGLSARLGEFSLKMLNDESISCDEYAFMYQSFWKK